MPRFILAAAILALGALATGSADAGWKWFGSHHKKTYRYTTVSSPCSTCGEMATVTPGQPIAPTPDAHGQAPAPQPYDDKSDLPADGGPAKVAPPPPADAAPIKEEAPAPAKEAAPTPTTEAAPKKEATPEAAPAPAKEE